MSVTLRDGWLVFSSWQPGSRRVRAAGARRREELLDGFLRIQTPADALRFAKSWGPLGQTHTALSWPGGHAQSLDGPSPPPGSTLADWEEFIFDTLSLDGPFTRPTPVPDIFECVECWVRAAENCRRFRWALSGLDDHLPSRSLRSICEHVMHVMRKSRAGGLSLVPQGRGARLVRRFEGATVEAAVVFALVDELGGDMPAAVCHHCGQIFYPVHRRPKTGQRSFCPACRGAGRPAYWASRDRRERERAAPSRRTLTGRSAKTGPGSKEQGGEHAGRH